MPKLRIVTLVVDEQQATFYLEGGGKHFIPQGDPILKPITDAVIPILAQNLIASIDTDEYVENPYKDYEKKSEGGIKFFRIAKKFVKHLFAAPEEVEPIAPITVGTAPEVQAQKTVPNVTKSIHAVDQIMANARPLTSNHIAEDHKHEQDKTESEDTTIAVIEDKVVPGVEKLKGHITHSSNHGNTKGMDNLLKRVSKVIDRRGHSMEDLLRFLEKADLPIADDGSIIAYKILQKNPSKPGRFRDIHSKRVDQGIGSYVVVDESLVDKDRSRECSNGLHVARRGYISSFLGDVCTIIKMDPEDVITVPHRDPSKIRVMGYHILGLIEDADYQKLLANQPFTDSSHAQKLLTGALRGNHVARLEEVRIRGQKGQDILVTPLVKGKPALPVVEKADTDARAFDDGNDNTKAVNPRETSKTVVETKKAQAGQSKKDKALALFENAYSAITQGKLAAAQTAFEALHALKKEAKCSWEKLGINEQKLFEIRSKIQSEGATPATPAKAEPKKKETAIPTPKVKAEPKKQVKPAPVKTPNVKTVKALKDAKAGKVVKTGTVKQTMKELNAPSTPKPLTINEQARFAFKEKRWTALRDIKAKAKKSWAAMGFTRVEEGIIIKKLS